MVELASYSQGVGLANKITMRYLNLCIPNGQCNNPAS